MEYFLTLYIIANIIAFFVMAAYFNSGRTMTDITVKHVIFCIIFLPLTLLVAVLVIIIASIMMLIDILDGVINKFNIKSFLDKKIFK